MDLVLYELRGKKGQAFSPFCWRARMALAHKGLQARLEGVCFSDIRELNSTTVPVLSHRGASLRDSWEIALYLDGAFADSELLFPDASHRHLARFLHHWVGTTLHSAVFRLMALDIWHILDDRDQDYFRQTREKRLGDSLESVLENRQERIADLERACIPLESLLSDQPFISGPSPAYADYIAFGAFQWMRVVGAPLSSIGQGAISAWFERCLDLYDGLGRREPSGVGSTLA